MGGMNSYGYAVNPLSQLDPLGLMGRPSGAVGGRGIPGALRFGGGAAFKGFCGSGWNQQFVPESIVGANFSDACHRHDDCYSRCGADKHDCDLQLKRDMTTECDKIPHGSGKWAICKTTAIDYLTAVSTWGGSAFQAAQSGCPLCSAP
jgi:hypothetical protein